eukprot:COSAG02_NODE_4507_length_5283_cov_3.981674_2_plen_188_part_00
MVDDGGCALPDPGAQGDEEGGITLAEGVRTAPLFSSLSSHFYGRGTVRALISLGVCARSGGASPGGGSPQPAGNQRRRQSMLILDLQSKKKAILQQILDVRQELVMLDKREMAVIERASNAHASDGERTEGTGLPSVRDPPARAGPAWLAYLRRVLPWQASGVAAAPCCASGNAARARARDYFRAVG